MAYIYHFDTNTLITYNPDLNRLQVTIPIKAAIPKVLMSVMFMIVVIVFWAFYMSNKILGPYDRIVRELDDVIDGKKKDHIGVRDGDEMFLELLKRINTLVDRVHK